MAPKNLFGTLLLAIRVQKRTSQKDLAFAAKIDQSHLSGIESGRRAPPNDPVLSRLCGALQATDTERTALRRALELSRFARKLRGDHDFVGAVVNCALKEDPLFSLATSLCLEGKDGEHVRRRRNWWV